jgi:hypothetical protein
MTHVVARSHQPGPEGAAFVPINDRISPRQGHVRSLFCFSFGSGLPEFDAYIRTTRGRRFFLVVRWPGRTYYLFIKTRPGGTAGTGEHVILIHINTGLTQNSGLICFVQAGGGLGAQRGRAG